MPVRVLRAVLGPVYYPVSDRTSTWGQIGGTSESAPIIGAVFALSGNTSSYANAIPHGHAAAGVQGPQEVGRPDRSRYAEGHRRLLIVENRLVLEQVFV